MWIFFFLAGARAWAETERPVGLGVLLLELGFGLAVIVRRQPLTVSRSRIAWLSAVGAVGGALLLRPAYAPVGGVGPLWEALQVVGAWLALACLFVLGRSFGIVAANRGLKTNGPYRIIRHPIYAAYFLTLAGYLLENPSLRNVVIVCALTALQIVRIEREERCLRVERAYRAYSSHVRYRLIPYVF
jgi:protein-S-isoprenylcysteine O-methyltransferase Ste14